jgi:flagellar protein FliO/FliZ
MNLWTLPRLLGLALGVCLFLLLLASKASAIEPNSPLFSQDTGVSTAKDASKPLALPEEKPNPSPGVFSTLLRLFLALALTIGLIFATIWGLKIVWEKRGWNNLAEEGKPIKVLTSTYLAPRKSIHLVEVGKRILVLGVGNDEINCLDVIQEPEEVESLRSASSQQGFPKIFDRVLRKNETADGEAEAQKIIRESSQLVGGYVEKLKKISTKKKTETESVDKKT